MNKEEVLALIKSEYNEMNRIVNDPDHSKAGKEYASGKIGGLCWVIRLIEGMK